VAPLLQRAQPPAGTHPGAVPQMGEGLPNRARRMVAPVAQSREPSGPASGPGILARAAVPEPGQPPLAAHRDPGDVQQADATRRRSPAVMDARQGPDPRPVASRPDDRPQPTGGAFPEPAEPAEPAGPIERRDGAPVPHETWQAPGRAAPPAPDTDQLIAQHVVPALVEAGLLRDPEVTIQREPAGPRVPARQPVVRVVGEPPRTSSGGDVHVHIDRVVVVQPEPRPSGPARARPTRTAGVDHEAYLAGRRQERP
jgi:hypothetical protein